jgi:hypothetical protein
MEIDKRVLRYMIVEEEGFALMRLCTKSRSFIGFLGVKIGLSGLEKAFKMRLKRSY